ncbi:MAG: polysaccharide biosynthesis/export family protein [Kiritimatiellia bacterium]
MNKLFPISLLICALGGGCALNRPAKVMIAPPGAVVEPQPVKIETPPPVAPPVAAPAPVVAPPAIPQRSAEEIELSKYSPSSALDRVRIRETRKALAERDHDYRVGADDVLEISVFEWEMNQETRTLALTVSKSGAVAMPVLGSIQVAGKSVEQVQAFLSKELETRNLIANPRVAVVVKEHRSRRVSAIGAVNTPGIYALQENATTLTDFLALAGGPAADAASVAYILKPNSDATGEPQKIAVDLDELFKTRRNELDAALTGGEVVYLPVAPQIFVYGSVLQPGAISLKKPTTFLESLALAGGFQDNADTRRVRLNRKLRGVREQSLYINVDRLENGQEQDPYLQEGDIIIVSASGSKNFFSGVWDFIRGIFSVSYRLNP